MTQDEKKKAVAHAALAQVVDGKIVGVGTGSTANCFIDALAAIKHRIGGAVASSEATSNRLKAWAGKVPELRSGAAFVAGWHAPRIARLRKSVLPSLEDILWGKAPWRR